MDAIADYHPLFDLAATVLISAVTIGLAPASSHLRTAVFPVLVALSWHCVAKCPEYISRSAWASSVGGYTLSYLFHYLDVGLLSRWSFELQGPATELVKVWNPPATKPFASRDSPQDDTIFSRLRFGFSVVFSWRFAGTPYQARGLPMLPEKLQRSRGRFLTHTLRTITVCYLILDAMDVSADPKITETFYSLDKVAFFSRIRNVSAEEAVMRFFAAVGLAAGLVSVQRGLYSILAFVAVGTGLSGPADWPPFNGPFGAIYSLRSFWGVFWHQINTHRLRVTSNYLLCNVLRLPREAKAVRYLRPWVIFLLSGLLHIAIDMSSGMLSQESGAMRFFLIQPMGIVIEDAVRAAYRAVSPRPSGSGGSGGGPTVAERCVGALWVGLWMTWTAPAYLFPVLAKTGADGGTAGVVPVSVIGCVRRLMA